MKHLWCVTSLQSLGSLTLRFGGTRKKMLVNWISHSSGRYRDPTFGHQKWTFFGFASKKWNHLARTTLTDFVTSRGVTEPIKSVRWRFGLRALALRGGSSYVVLQKCWSPFRKVSLSRPADKIWVADGKKYWGFSTEPSESGCLGSKGEQNVTLV